MSSDVNDRLAESIRGFYLDAALPGNRLELIARHASRARAVRRRRRYTLAGAAALVVALLLAAFSLYPYWQHHRLTQRVASEVLYNFHKSAEKNITLAEYEDLAQVLPKVEFPLTDMPRRIVESSELVGGRYCSLQGAMAAQLRLRRRADNRTGILYVVERSENFKKIDDSTVKIGDFTVDLFSDEGRFFALIWASPTRNPS